MAQTASFLTSLRWICATFLCFVFLSAGNAVAQSTLPAHVRDALDRLEVNAATDYDKALLFKYNDDINAAALNGEIADDVYQAAQRDYAATNRSFAADAAADAGADFTVQNPTAPDFSPGTDSDYITVVDSKEQIGKMQDGYNNRVNDYLESHGINNNPRNDWHNKLDTDFMADPRYVSEADFKEIAKYNNDAYTRRHAVEFEAIIRKKGGPGRIDPQHIVAYTEEMDDFARKKGKLLDDMLANPSRFNDPRARADAFRTMAQQQKYTSRIQMAEDLLRAQEGLPPRVRGDEAIAKLGSKRSWGNSKNIRDAYQVADKTLATSIDSLAETMAEVAKKNPQFRARAGKDIAALIERLPEGQRAGAIERIRANHGAGFADEVADAARARGTSVASLDNARGAGAVDDLKAAGKLDDATRAGLSVADDVADASKLRTGLRTATGVAMDALGVIGVGADLYSAAQHAKVLLQAREEALNPKLTDAEADALFEKAQAAANGLIEAGTMGALMEAYPPFAAAMGTWVLTRHGGEWVLANTETGQAINRIAADLADRHISAFERAREDLTEFLGGESERMRAADQVTELCAKFTRAIASGELFLRGNNKSVDVCNYVREGNLEGIYTDLVTREHPCTVPEAQLTRAQTLLGAGDLGGAETALDSVVPGTCVQVAEGVDSTRQQIEGRIEELTATAGQAAGSCDASTIGGALEKLGAANHPRLGPAYSSVRDVSGTVQVASAAFANAQAAFRSGDIAGARAGLETARANYGRLGDAAGCGAEMQKIEVASSKVERVGAAVARIDAAIAACDLDKMAKFKAQLAKLNEPTRALSDRIGLLESGSQECKRKDPDLARAVADDDCQSRHGEGYFAGAISASGSYNCLPDQRTASAWCNANNKGSGWTATKVQADGTYDCQLTKAGRNAVCQSKNGKGWYAGKPGKDGSYSCYMGKSARASACRRKHGKGWRAGKLRKDGSYLCYPPKRKKVVRRKTPKRRATNTNRNTNQAARDAANAAAAAAAAAAIIGIIQSQGGGGGRSNCHTNPTTGQLHCGSN